MNKRILLVEDNADVQSFNQFLLEKQGFTVLTAATLAAARGIVVQKMPDAIVLDIGMPDGSGLDFLRETRQTRETSNIPVLVLTGYGQDADVVRGFKSGCDDYLSKPYTFEVLLVRLTRMLQSADRIPERVSAGPLTIEVLSGQALLHGEDMLLTQKEFAMLLLFMQNENQIISAEFIFETVWKAPIARNTSAIQMAVSRLRRKVKPAGYCITSLRNKGYVFERI